MGFSPTRGFLVGGGGVVCTPLWWIENNRYNWEVLYRYVGFYSSLGCIVRWVRGGAYRASRLSINAGGGVNELSR